MRSNCRQYFQQTDTNMETCLTIWFILIVCSSLCNTRELYGTLSVLRLWLALQRNLWRPLSCFNCIALDLCTRKPSRARGSCTTIRLRLYLPPKRWSIHFPIIVLCFMVFTLFILNFQNCSIVDTCIWLMFLHGWHDHCLYSEFSRISIARMNPLNI